MAYGLGTETRSYDNLDRLLTVGQGGTPFSYVYDAVGNVTRRTYPDGRVYDYAHDALNRLATVSENSATLATYGYDVSSNQLSRGLPAANGYTETRVIDRAGRVTEVKHSRASGGTEPLAPNSVLEQTNLTGSLADIDDDPDAPDGAWMVATANTVNTSVRTGFPTPQVAPGGVQTFKAQVRKRGGSATPTARIDLYENGTLRASGPTINVTSTSGQVVTQTFDLGAIALTDPTGAGVEMRVVGSFAGSGGNRASIDIGAVRWHEAFPGPTTLARLVYTLDPVGNPTRVDRTGTLAGVQTLGYDNIDRLTAVCFQASCPGGGDPKIAWSYDGVGNRLSETRATGTTTYTYDNADRLLSATGLGSFGYDANGNQTSAGGKSYGYDLANRLTSISDGTDYSYDGDGVRTHMTSGNIGTTFTWDVNQPLPLLVSEGDEFILPPASPLVPTPATRRYAYGTGELTQTTIAQTTNTLHVHQDRLGSIVATTSPGGLTQGAADYEPYGPIRSSSGSLGKMLFTGQYQDPTGLYHLRARQYDAATGTLTARDSVSPPAASPASSAYGYASARPTTMTDPSGMIAQAEKESTSGIQVAQLASSVGRGLDRARVVWYLRHWALDTNPAYGRVTSPFRFWKENDCTNFISQALYYGGWQQDEVWNVGKRTECIGSLYWFSCTTKPKFSLAWIRVSDFIQYLTSRRSSQLSNSFSNAMLGDVVAADWDGGTNWHHLMGITKISPNGQIEIASHGSDRRDFDLFDNGNGRPRDSIRELERGARLALIHLRG